MRLITLEGTSDTDDGTGLVPELLEKRLRLLPPGWTARVPFFKGIHPSAYVPALKAIRAAGGKIMLQPVDSERMARLSISEFGHVVEEVISTCGFFADVVEYANEVNGQRHNSWTGSHAFEKAMAGLAACKRHGVKRAVTYYYDCDDPNWLFDWIAKHQVLAADYALVSFYPRLATVLPHGILPKLPGATAVGVGEYGTENFDGKHDMLLVERMETRPKDCPADIGGGGYWDFYLDVVASPDDTLLKVFQTAWGRPE